MNIDGKSISTKVKEEVKEEVREIFEKYNEQLSLAVILVGENPASEVYVRNKLKASENSSIKSILIRLPADVEEGVIIDKIHQLNADDSVNGILLQLPLPKGFNESKIINEISPLKDVDGLTFESQGRLFGGVSGITPCTPSGVIRLLDEYGIEIKGKNAVVIGRSLLAGKPMSALLLDRDATVTICHSKTVDLVKHTREADIVVVCVGKSEFLTGDMVKEGAVVIDIGINRTDSGLKGDAHYESLKDKVSYITPVPGGVGPMTVAMLLKNTVKAFKLQKGIK